jgi:hypothetical protein
MATLQVVITRMTAKELPEVGRVLGAAFASSPLEQAVRGPIDDRQRRGLVRAYTAACRIAGHVAVAWSDDRIVGAIRWVRSPACQLRWSQKLAMAPTAIAAVGRNLPRAVTWVSAWSSVIRRNHASISTIDRTGAAVGIGLADARRLLRSAR